MRELFLCVQKSFASAYLFSIKLWYNSGGILAEKYKSHFFLWNKSLESKINLTEQTEDYE